MIERPPHSFAPRSLVVGGFMIYKFFVFANSQSRPKPHRCNERVYCAIVDDALKMKLNHESGIIRDLHYPNRFSSHLEQEFSIIK